MSRGARAVRNSAQVTRRATSVFLIAALTSVTAVAATVASPTPASALPGTPGEMQAPSVVWYEDFQNVPTENTLNFVNTLVAVPDATNRTNATPKPTEGYTSVGGDAYSQDSQWSQGEGCNGLLVKSISPVGLGNGNDDNLPNHSVVADCGTNTNWNRYRAQAQWLSGWQSAGVYPYAGVIEPSNTIYNNYAVTAAGNNDPVAGVLFETQAIIDTEPGRYYQASIDFATMTCQNSGYWGMDPQITLAGAGGTVGAFSTVPDTCRDGIGSQVGNGSDSRMTRSRTLVGDTALRADGSALSFTLTQTEDFRGGTDEGASAQASFDNAVVIDTTPQLDKDFAQAVYEPGDTVRLSFTVTNTYSPGQPDVPSGPKEGWSFTDVLPAGLSVAGEPNIVTTCTNGSLDIGGATLTGSGDLAGDALESCAFEVDVVANSSGTFTNTVDDVTVDGLQLPADADVTYGQGGICEAGASLFQSSGGGGAEVYLVDLVSGESEFQTLLDGFGFNAAGYFEDTGYFYGARAVGQAVENIRLWAISTDYSERIDLGPIDFSTSPFSQANFPNGVNVGDVSPEGLLYLRGQQGQTFRWIAVDIRASSPDYMTVVDQGNANGPSNWVTGADWVYNDADGLLYSIGYNSNNYTAGLLALDPAGGGTTLVQNLGRLRSPDGGNTNGPGRNPAENNYGATYQAGKYIYGSANGSGHIWRVNLEDPSEVDFMAYGPSSTGNDGARCRAALETDFSDAPSSYGALLSNAGPYHGIRRDTAGEIALAIGADVTTEDNGQPDPAAAADDDDAFTAPPELVISRGGEVSLDIPVTNTTGESADLVGLIDFDGNGTYEDDERAVVTGIGATGTATVTWTVPNDAIGAPSFLRLRLSTDGADAMPAVTTTDGGGVSDGEVEDWPIQLTSQPFQCVSDAFLFQNTPTDVTRFDLASGVGDEIWTNAFPQINAVGYNVLDNYMYGLTDDGNLVRVSGDGAFADLGPLENVSGVTVPLSGYQTGDVTTDGQLFAIRGNAGQGEWVQVDLDSDSATFGDIVEAGQVAIPAEVNNLSDWVYEPVADTFFSVARGNDTFHLVEFDHDAAGGATLEVLLTYPTLVAPNGDPFDPPTSGGAVGAMFADSLGFIYGVSNQSGQTWRFDPVAGTAEFFAYGAPTSSNDGARCVTASLDVDFGDAPAGYPTLLADDGARHSLVDFDEVAGTAPLMLGASVDAEDDGQPSAGADADGSDEDALSGDLVYPDDGSGFATAVSVTNTTGDVATVAGWVDLDNDGVFEDSERWIASAADGVTSVTLGFAGATVDDVPLAARLRIYPGEVSDPRPDGAAYGGEVEDYLFQPTPEVPELLMTKNVVGDPASVSPGESVTFELVLENIGNGPYTEENPAYIIDQLAGALDDSEENLAVVVDPEGTGSWTYNAVDERLDWSGPIDEGDTVTIRYTIVIDDPPTGDGIIDNAVYGPPGSNCDGLAGELPPECTTSTPVEGLEVVKSVSPEGPVAPGTQLDYTISVTNVGAAAYNSATLADDLSDVLLDADYQGNVGATVGDASVTGDLLEWSGDLNPGATATITYSVVVEDPLDGDGQLINAVTVPGSNCDPTGELDETCSTQVDVQTLAISKSATPAEVLPGGTVEYTISVENTGAVSYSGESEVVLVDDLTDVLAHASYDDGSAIAQLRVSSVPVGTIVEPDEATDNLELGWTGTLDPGEIVDITYSVTVDATVSPDTVLANTVTGPDGADCDPCSTDTPVRQLSASKVADTTTASPGELITYTVTMTNTGAVPYDEASGLATFTDDLTGALANAAFVEVVSATGTDPADRVAEVSTSGTPDIDTLTWTGPLAVGETVTVVYTLQVRDEPTAESTIDNGLAVPPETQCIDDCSTSTDLRTLQLDKDANVDEAVPGGEVEYLLAISNTGTVDYTDEDPAVITDDLVDLLDHGRIVGDITAEYNSTGEAAGELTLPNEDAGQTVLTWSGAIPAGETVYITIVIQVDDDVADNVTLFNAIEGPPESTCLSDCSASTPVRKLDISKTADTTEITPGGVITYTLTATNTGAIAYGTDSVEASLVDDLSDVLVDADFLSVTSISAGHEAETTDPSAPDNELTWTGPLEVGETVTIQYQVQVHDDVPDGAVLANTVTGPPESTCPEGCTVTIPGRALSIEKTTSTDTVAPGDTVDYTIVVENTGSIAYDTDLPAVVRDSLGDVLDHGVLTGDVEAVLAGTATDVGTLTLPTEADSTLVWSGPLEPTQIVEITYSVLVDDPVTEGAVLENSVTGPAESTCVTGEADGCSTTTEVRQLDINKTVDVQETVPGGTVTYTVTIANTGSADYDEAPYPVVTDELDQVLTHSTFGALVSAEDSLEGDRSDEVTVPTADNAALTWSGPLEAGQTVTLQYTVEVAEDLDEPTFLINAISGPDEAVCQGTCGTVTPVRSLDVFKTVVAPTGDALPGQTVQYELEITNTGAVPYAAPETTAVVTDDLSGVLEEATFTSVDSIVGAADAAVTSPLDGGTELVFDGPIAVGGTVTITYTVTVDDPLAGDSDGRLLNSVTGPPESTCVDGTEPGCTTDTGVRSLLIDKVADAEEVTAGSTVTYTVTATNTGGVDYTEGDPATIVDDMSAMLDGTNAEFGELISATDNNAADRVDEVTTPTLADTTLEWEGPLDAGDTVTIVYTVVFSDPLDNPDPTNSVSGPPESNCPAEDPCVVSLPDRALAVTKQAGASEVQPGADLLYLVTITNTGTAHYTADHPAEVTDDLTEVLEYATLDTYFATDSNGVSRDGELVIDGNVLTWSGPLLAGDEVVISYSVIVDSDLPENVTLVNSVTGPDESTCPADEPCTTDTPVRSVAIDKSAASAEVLAGGEQLYTVTITNTGAVDYESPDSMARILDDLSGVLDDAEFGELVTAGPTEGELIRSSEVTVPADASLALVWEGPLAVGETVILQYTVVVDAEVSGGATLDNIVTGPPEAECVDTCSTSTPVRALDVVKSVTTDGLADAGEDVTYRIRVTNTGGADYALPDTAAAVSDDLSDLLADGTLGTVTAIDSTGADRSAGLDIDGSTLAWSGALASGDFVDITYVVSLDAPLSATSDGNLVNTVTGPPESPCVTGTEPGCTTDTPVRSLDIDKVADTDSVVPGDTIEYTVTIVNNGGIAYSDAEPAEITDDMTDVLADAEFGGLVSATDSGGSDRTTQVVVPDEANGKLTLEWSGQLEVDEEIVLVYTVVVDDEVSTDVLFANTVYGPPESPCVDGCTVTVPDRQFTYSKAVSTDGEVAPGDQVTYDLTITNTGDVAYETGQPEPAATVTDDLSDVLLDASFDGVSAITGADGARDVSEASLMGTDLVWTGALAVGETVIVTYTVTINDALAATSDGILTNTVTGPPEASCADGEDCTTSTPVRALELAKYASVDELVPGGTVTYTLVVENNGGLDYNSTDGYATVTDDMSGVLPAGTLVGDIALTDSSGTRDPSVTEDVIDAPTAGNGYVLTWTGPLVAGDVLEITYTVSVPADATGDLTLTNQLTGPP